MKIKNLPLEEQLKRYKRRFRILLALFVLLIAAVGFYIYLNFDYLVFKHFISHHYIYTDTLDQLYKEELKRDVKGSYFSYFDNMVISVVTRQIRSINNERYTYLYTPESYKQTKIEEKEEAAQSEIKVLNDSTIYMRITNFSKYTKKFVYDNVDQLKKYPYLIIDLRDNYGGDIPAMADISDLFIPKGSTIATDKMRMFNWVYKAKKDKILDFKKIIILQNKNTASASENMIAALKDNLDNVTLIGETTFGKGIGQFTMPLKRGFAVKATTLLWFTPSGENIQGKGIKPDIYYAGDDFINYALLKLTE
ncbi:MAG TPA: hypothetical protein GXX14_05690 [Clostridiaceae bacterium]|nr:hypothetical protein [Clostridiaceae bacterium]